MPLRAEELADLLLRGKMSRAIYRGLSAHAFTRESVYSFRVRLLNEWNVWNDWNQSIRRRRVELASPHDVTLNG